MSNRRTRWEMVAETKRISSPCLFGSSWTEELRTVSMNPVQSRRYALQSFSGSRITSRCELASDEHPLGGLSAHNLDCEKLSAII